MPTFARLLKSPPAGDVGQSTRTINTSARQSVGCAGAHTLRRSKHARRDFRSRTSSEGDDGRERLWKLREMGLRHHHRAARSKISCSKLHRTSIGNAPDPGDVLAPEGAPGDALDPEGALVPEPGPDPAPGVAPDPSAEAVKSGSSPARGPAPGIADPSTTRPGPTEFEERRKR